MKRLPVIAIILLLSGQVWGANETYYVDASVSSSGAGTSWATAKKTFGEAKILVNDGDGGADKDTILIYNGTYTETISFGNDADYNSLTIAGCSDKSDSVPDPDAQVLVYNNGASSFYDNGADPDNITFMYLTFREDSGAHATLNNAPDGWTWIGCTFEGEDGASDLLDLVNLPNYKFDRCRFFTNGNTDNSGYGVDISGSSSGDFVFCTFESIGAEPQYMIYDRSTGSTGIYNCFVGHGGTYALINTGNKTDNAYNNIFQGMTSLTSAYVVNNTAGTMNFGNNLTLGSPFDTTKTVNGETDQGENLTNLNPQITDFNRTGYLILRVDDSGNFDVAQNVATYLSSRGYPGVVNFGVNRSSWNTADNATLASLVAAETLEVFAHQHSDSTLNSDHAGTLSCTSCASPQFKIDTSTNNVYVDEDGDNSADVTFNYTESESNLDDWITYVKANGGDASWAWANGGGTVVKTLLLEALADADWTGVANNLPLDVDVDSDCTDGNCDRFYKTEVYNMKSWLETIVGETVEGFATAHDTFCSDGQEAIRTSGFLVGASADYKTLASIDIFSIPTIGASTLLGVNEAATKAKVRAILFSAAKSGMAISITSHRTDIPLPSSDPNGWQYIMDVVDEFGDAIQVVTFSEFAAIVRDSGNWVDAGNGIWNRNYTKDECADFTLLPSSPCINAGTDPFSDGDGDQYDMAGYLVWSDSSDSPVGKWRDGVDIGAYGWRKSGGGILDLTGRASNGLLGRGRTPMFWGGGGGGGGGTSSGGGSSASTYALLLETGDYLLLENGDKLLLE